MRELSLMETEYLSGATGELFGITGIEEGLLLARVAGVAAASFGVGYGLGEIFNAGWEWATGNTFGVSLYNAAHC